MLGILHAFPSTGVDIVAGEIKDVALTKNDKIATLFIADEKQHRDYEIECLPRYTR